MTSINSGKINELFSLDLNLDPCFQKQTDNWTENIFMSLTKFN